MSQAVSDRMASISFIFLVLVATTSAFFSTHIFADTTISLDATGVELSSDDFVTTWQTDNPGTSNSTSITVPMIGGPYDVDWNNDGIFDGIALSGSVTHDFGSAGTYTIRIRGTYDSIQFNNLGDKLKILSLDQWGTNTWTSMWGAFYGAANLTVPASDTPNFSAVTSMLAMFAGASSANPGTSGWDTSAVTDMRNAFAYTASANPAVGNWDTSAVTTMSRMFTAATAANPDTSSWDTSSVTDMSYMFFQATLANPDAGSWNTAAVTNMLYMFSGATAFDQDIGSWDVTSLSYATNMLFGVTLSTANYDSLLVGWDAQVLQPGVNFHAGNSSYCSLAASTARANMAASDSWTITDGGQACSPGTCNINMVTGGTETSEIVHEACEILTLGPDFIAAYGANVSTNSGWDVEFLPGFTVEQGATLNANVCGQSLCMISSSPMPYGCHSCVSQICNIDPACCDTDFDQVCLGMVDTVCGLVCE